MRGEVGTGVIEDSVKPGVPAENPQAARSPFFVVGVQRSGTTMLRLMLNSHPRLAIPFESGFIPVFYRRLADYGDLGSRQNAARLLADIARYPKVQQGGLVLDAERILGSGVRDYADLVGRIFWAYAERTEKARWGDKTPAYVTELDVLWTLFPSCRIVHLVRDGRDVAISLRTLQWGSPHIPRLAADWHWKTMLAHKIGNVLGEHYLEVRYEDLVLNPERILRRICVFLGEPYDPQMLAYPSAARKEMPADSLRWHERSVLAPDPSRLYMWKRMMSRADRAIFEETAGSTLGLFGYEQEHLPNDLRTRMKKVYYLAVKRW